MVQAEHKHGGRFTIVDQPEFVSSIDVIRVHHQDVGRAVEVAQALLMAALEDGAFVAGAAHRSLPPWQQPLVWAGVVPLRYCFVALYAQWRASPSLKAFAGTARGRKWLEEASPLSPDFATMLQAPRSNLYVPTLLDATGELCAEQDPCTEGLGVGPILDEADERASFINIFRTTPERQQRLLDATYAIMPVARKHRGYLRTALHRSLDGTRVANYGQYRTVSDIRRMYFYPETVKRFAAIAFLDVTEPTTLLGRPIWWRGRPIGSTPRLRCYTVERVVVARAIP